jgi:hypothetical protein
VQLPLQLVLALLAALAVWLDCGPLQLPHYAPH